MTNDASRPASASPLPQPAAAAASAKREGSYVDWSCALAGAAVAGAVSFVLVTFGSAIGLSIVSPWPQAGATGWTVVVFATLWAVFVHGTAFGAGGYLAGRMRRPWLDAAPEEAQFRDGAHGVLVWAIAALFGAMLLSSAASGVVRAGAQGAGQAIAQNSDAVSTAMDSLFRVQEPTPQSANSNEARAEATRILTASVARGELLPADRTYLARVISARTGLQPAAAEARIAEVTNQARVAANQARIAGVMAAFLAGATLLLGVVIAWSAARIGGQHRDEGMVWRGFRSVPFARPEPRP